MVNLVIKWGKEVIREIDWVSTESLLELKAKIYALTLVPVDKQKLIYKGTVLKVMQKKEKTEFNIFFVNLG